MNATMNHTAIWYFERFGLLGGLSDEQKQKVSHASDMLQIKRGQAVYMPGDPSKYVYLVKAGAVKIVGTAPEGSEVILTILTPGDIFGELALMSDEPRNHRAEAAEDTLLCEVPRDLLIELMRETPDFGLHVTKLLGQRVYTLGMRVEELLGKCAPARLAHAIADLSGQHGIADGDGVLIPLRLSQGDLGKLVGLTRETVNGILHVWREQGILEMDRNSIRVRDPERLRRVRR
jgi:CRP/FNR family cyclic AMP-dependent transcriptional regulator